MSCLTPDIFSLTEKKKVELNKITQKNHSCHALCFLFHVLLSNLVFSVHFFCILELSFLTFVLYLACCFIVRVDSFEFLIKLTPVSIPVSVYTWIQLNTPPAAQWNYFLHRIRILPSFPLFFASSLSSTPYCHASFFKLSLFCCCFVNFITLFFSFVKSASCKLPEFYNNLIHNFIYVTLVFCINWVLPLL